LPARLEFISWTDYRVLKMLEKKEPCSRYLFEQCEEKYFTCLQEVKKEELQRVRNIVKERGGKFVAIFDTRWSKRGFHANEGTTVCRNWDGTSKQMEGNGVHHITKELFDEGFEIIGVCHDSDACTFDEVIQFFLK